MFTNYDVQEDEITLKDVVSDKQLLINHRLDGKTLKQKFMFSGRLPEIKPAKMKEY